MLSLCILRIRESKKATGPDDILNKALKMIPPNLLTCITKIFNKCPFHHYLPPSWKIAHVLMFPKPGQNQKLPKSHASKTKRTLLLIYKSFLMSNMASAPTTAVYISFFVLPT
ncbi:hypothetical protein AVEN_4206-1 [Araneus ventricosus]|uniref:RNA-directed DNA polymerase from transposon X-element n=1 Tax=Araneus ventricosus TaxID=182803 RepID=A0A4Y2FA74_ARAVE|nr:hypothetical protein AVEN_4206-1 [Araneus ventricosus]